MIPGSTFHLRYPRKEEIPHLVHLMNLPEARGQFLPRELFLPAVMEKRLMDAQESREHMEFFVIADQADQILGRVFHFKTVPYFQSREIGYSMFTDEVRGKGIMTEAVTLLRDYLFDTTLLNRLEIHMNTENKASERVAVKCGFQLEGTARGAVFDRGRYHDILMYALLRDEWKALRES
ncbi:GNAT family protein [Undibacterium luofuense]|uniref:GNAT family N-acetyltransferase n=1 Tax=Undibacterium luofuense TaxID=2828733 RepID=UPI0030EF1808